MTNRVKLFCWVHRDLYGFGCPKGLWEVEGHDLGKMIKEAMDLYRKHKEAGDYDKKCKACEGKGKFAFEWSPGRWTMEDCSPCGGHGKVRPE